MKKYLSYLLISVIGLLSGCSDDNTEVTAPTQHKESAILFTSEYPTWSQTTRASIEVDEKKDFTKGDIIHVQGEFELEGGSKVWRYDTYIYDKNKWIPTDGEDNTSMKWPWNAVQGRFTAYYIPGTTDALPEGSSYTGNLGGNYQTSDPLWAETEGWVKRDYAVNFKFKHLCTRLVILNTKNNYAEEYWFNRQELRNTYTLTNKAVTEDGQEHFELGFDFTQNPSLNEGAISSVKVLPGNTGTDSPSGYVVYYLEPGKYKGSALNYSNNRLYLTLNVNELDTPNIPTNLPEDTPAEEGLLCGISYILDIEKAQGIIDNEKEKDPWDNPDPPVTDFDIQEFLNAIEKGVEYLDILKFDEARNLVLMKNLDFEYNEFDPKTLPSNIVFDGNYHYITGAVHALFSENLGLLRNLEIRNSQIEGYAGESATRAGAVARLNKGDINNVRLKNIYIKIPAFHGTERVASAGCVVGEHEQGHISDIYLIGNISIEVTNPDEGDADGRVVLGGIAGQANGATSPAVKNVFLKQDEDGNEPNIKIKLSCSGGAYSVGGIIGMMSVGMENCTISATIDCSESNAVSNCVGGLFGRDLSDKSGIEIKNCNVSGVIYGSNATTDNTGARVTGFSNTGGLGGNVQNTLISISECSSFCEVYDYFTAKNASPTQINDETFCTGGAFGAISPSNRIVNNCTAWGKVSAAAIDQNAQKGGSYVGSFIGYAANSQNSGGNNKINETENGSLQEIGKTIQ